MYRESRCGRTAVGVSHDDHVGADAVDRPAGVDQRLALLDARRSRGDQGRDCAPAPWRRTQTTCGCGWRTRRTAAPRACRAAVATGAWDPCAAPACRMASICSVVSWSMLSKEPSRAASLSFGNPLHQQHLVGAVGLLQFHFDDFVAVRSESCGPQNWLRSAARDGRGR